MVHILLTGASGKLGSHTLKYLLERHHQVTATDIVPLHPAVLESLSSQARKNLIAFLPCDLNDYEAFEAIVKGCRPVVEGLIHLGSIPDPTRHDPRYVHNSNVAGSFNVLQTAASLGIERIVQASSVNAVGLSYTPEGHHRFDALPVREDTPKRPVGQAEISMDYLAQGRKASVCLPWMLTTFRRMHMLYPKREYFLAIDCRIICELQADALCRYYHPQPLRIASLRFHYCTIDYAYAVRHNIPRDAFAWTSYDACASACLLGLTSDGWRGHEVFYVVADENCWEGSADEPIRTVGDAKSSATTLELMEWYWKNKYTEVDEAYWDGRPRRSVWDNSKAKKLLGWDHDRASLPLTNGHHA